MRPRLIPVLLLDRRRRLVKTIGFGERTYVGDPFNVMRLFNEKEVDEIVVLDIDATRDGRAADTGFVAELASECFMPLAYGGGLASMAACEPLARAGVEKFVLGTAATNAGLVREMAASFGSQAVVACADYRSTKGNPVFVGGGRTAAGLGLADYVRHVEQLGIGELIVQSIDRDGLRSGMDIDTARAIGASARVPVIALGGAGEVAHLDAALAAGASAAASGSAFSFIGKLRAVLITYPEPEGS